MSEDDFSTFLKEASPLIGLDCASYDEKFLRRRIDTRLSATNIGDYASYGSFLAEHESEQKKLFDDLTIKVTTFFRDTSAWSALKDVFKKVIDEKNSKNDKTIRIWCAGCSSGEELFSAIILFHEVLGDDAHYFEINGLGTDIDKNIIASAKSGIYSQLQFHDVPDDIRQKYFQAEAGMFVVNPVIREKVSFHVEDILSMAHPANVDVLFCRNTVIYFNKDAKNNLYPKFFDALHPNGYFVMGRTEVLGEEWHNKFKVVNMHEKIYKKLS